MEFAVLGVIAVAPFSTDGCFALDGATNARILTRLIEISNKNAIKLTTKNPQGVKYINCTVAGDIKTMQYPNSSTAPAIRVLIA